MRYHDRMHLKMERSAWFFLSRFILIWNESVLPDSKRISDGSLNVLSGVLNRSGRLFRSFSFQKSSSKELESCALLRNAGWQV
jgi:hypothetical protein